MKEVSFILKIFEASYMQRWNDKLRPIEFYELDKQAHKMMIAYFIAFFEKDQEKIYPEMLMHGLFEFLQRVVITDIKPPVFHMIKKDKEKYKELNRYILSQIKDFIDLFGEKTKQKFTDYFESNKENLSQRILAAAHTSSSTWEFDVIKPMNPRSYDIDEVGKDLDMTNEKYEDLIGIKKINENISYMNFLNLCGELRYQSRWAHLHRIPKTSVLGHSVFVAWLAFYFSYSKGYCNKRIYNNFVGALFHDLPEALTRDIISPIKRGVEGLTELIKIYEDEQMDKIVYPMLPIEMANELAVFLENEFSNAIILDGIDIKIEDGDIPSKYDEDKYSPYDGEMIKACDDLAAYIEAASAMSNGCVSKEFDKAKKYIVDKYKKRGEINGIDFIEIIERLDKAI